MTLRNIVPITMPNYARAIVVSAALVLGIGVAAPSAQAATVNYVALGDSYSSGVGTANYDPASGSCLRSPQSYTSLWAGGHTVTSFRSVACSGATTADVLANQISALNSGTTLVTITVGGNDVGFADVVSTCQLGSDATCATAVNNATTAANTTLPAKLDQTYTAVRSAAPNAQLIVLGYPRLFELVSSCGLFGMSLAKRTILNGAANTLAGVIAGRVAAAGATFVDVRSIFTGHGICGSSSWLNGLTFPIVNSFHPNASGYSGGFLVSLNAITG
jgi:lysophospholipase L1-like esterase